MNSEFHAKISKASLKFDNRKFKNRISGSRFGSMFALRCRQVDSSNSLVKLKSCYSSSESSQLIFHHNSSLLGISCSSRPKPPGEAWSMKCVGSSSCQVSCLSDYAFPNGDVTLSLVCINGRWTPKNFEYNEIPPCRGSQNSIIKAISVVMTWRHTEILYIPALSFQPSAIHLASTEESVILRDIVSVPTTTWERNVSLRSRFDDDTMHSICWKVLRTTLFSLFFFYMLLIVILLIFIQYQLCLSPAPMPRNSKRSCTNS